MIGNDTKPLVYMTKTEALEQAISDMAKKMAPGTRLPSMSELGRTFRVSKVTLDIALKDLERRGLIMRKNGVGIFVAPRSRQKTVGLVFGFDIFDAAVAPYYRRFLQLTQSQAKLQQVQFRYYFDVPHNDQEVPAHDELMEDIDGGRIQGLIGVGILAGTMQVLERTSIPLVTLSSGHQRLSTYEVGVDQAAMIRLGVDALLAEGCSRIGLMATEGVLCATSQGVRPVTEVFQEALQNAGAVGASPLYFEHPAVPQTRPDNLTLDHVEWSRRTILQAWQKNRKAAQRPDGLLILDDQITYGALLALDELKVVVGTDIKIATEAIRDVPQFAGRALIRLEIDLVLIAQAMHQSLRTLMDGGTPTEEVISLPPQVSYQRHVELSPAYA